MLVSSPVSPSAETDALPASLEVFLASVGPRAFRFAEAGLRQREDAMDAVQDALLRMLDYADKPAAEWAPLFWSILRRRVIDMQRRRRFRLPFWRDNQDAEGGEIDWADPGPDPLPGDGPLGQLGAAQVVADGLAVDEDGTAVEAFEVVEGAQQRALARAARAEQGDHLAPADVEVDAGQDVVLAVPHRQVTDFDDHPAVRKGSRPGGGSRVGDGRRRGRPGGGRER